MISGTAEIVPTADEPVRAVDVLGRFAAVFRFAVAAGGGYSADGALALRTGPETWLETCSGGSIGGGLKVPFRPSPEDFGGHSLSVFGSAGMDLPDDQDQMVLVSAIFGFAIPEVRSVRVRTQSRVRTVVLDSTAGAFVVAVVGEGDVELQGLDERSVEIGRPRKMQA